MPLAAFSVDGGEIRLGKVFGDLIISLPEAAPDLPHSVKGFLEAGAAARDRFMAITIEDARPIALSDVRLHAPVPDPEKFLGIGMNYADHSEEAEKLGLEQPAISEMVQQAGVLHRGAARRHRQARRLGSARL